MFKSTLAILCALIPSLSGHGRLIEPPSRASAWRYGFDTPHNYNDHELYCGGFTRQWVRNEGRCGVCGDPWDTRLPRPHEYGGTYGQGVIVRRYARAGLITIRVELTASHNGYFQFAVCPDFRNTTQECLDEHTLRLARPQDGADGNPHRYYPRDGNKVYEMKYRLPDMLCRHCVLQWRYVAGNNWGNCPNGTGAVGCGPQEEFRACSDIKISGRGPEDEPPEETTPATSTPTAAPEPDGSYSPVAALVISIVSFLVIFLILFLLYFHYYQVGRQIKNWMKDGPNKNSEKNAASNLPPLPPPRTKKNRTTSDGNMHEIDLNDEESVA